MLKQLNKSAIIILNFCIFRKFLSCFSSLFDFQCFQVLDNDNRLAVYNEDYQPTFKVVHSVITKFANEMDECMEKKVELLKAQAEWTARMQAIKERQPINGEDSEDVGVGSHFDDDELSDSSYEPKIYRGSYTKLTHKGFYYRGSKSKITNPLMDLPDCKYKCQATGCSGTVQPMLKRNARIHIRSIEDHSCK